MWGVARSPRVRLAAIAVLVGGPAPAEGRAPDLDARHRPDAIVVRLAPEAARRVLPGGPARARLGLAGPDRVAAALGGVRFEREFAGESPPPPGSGAPDFTAFWIARLPAGVEPARAANAFAAAEGVAAAHPIAVVPLEAVPNDSLWSEAYYFQQPSGRDLGAVAAWDSTTGDTSIVVAVIDTGVLLDHPDLRGQMWTNRVEAGGLPGVDDDGNGFVDDVGGWDFVDLASDTLAVPGEDWRDADGDPNDFVAHGTAVAGVVGAATDNRIGVAGTAWKVRLMALRAGYAARAAPSGEIDLTYVAQAIRYATRMGAHVVNCSFSSVFQTDLEEAVTAATRAGVVIVVAAGNGGSPNYLGSREDVIAVAATDREDRVAEFSNRGPYVDFAAPGLTIATTSIARTQGDSASLRQPAYTTGASGTSFSSPLAAGAVALLQAWRRARGERPLLPIEALMRLAETADDISDWNPSVSGYGSGRLHLHRALAEPPGSHVVPVRVATVGPGVVLPSLAGRTVFAVATADGRLLALDAATGAPLRSATLPARPVGGVAAADLGAGRGLAMFVATADGTLSGFGGEGLQPLPGWPVAATGARDGGTFEPALGDLDGDGALEVVWGGEDGNVWAWRADGARAPGFPRPAGGAGRNVRIALSDLDGAPGVEIVAAGRYGELAALRGDGTLLPGWPAATAAAPYAPAIGRLGGGAAPTIVVVAGGEVSAFAPDGARRWTRSLPGFASESPALGDLDRDGGDEIVLARTPNVVTVLDSAGLQWTGRGWPRTVPQPHGPLVVGPLAPGGGPGILQFAPGVGLIALGADGAGLRGFPKPGIAGAAPSLAETDGDGRTEILAGSGADSLVYVYDAGPGSWSERAAWPTPRANFARTGSRLHAPPIAPLDDAAPERVGDLAAVAVGTRSVELRWTAPADAGRTGRADRYELRHAPHPLSEATFASGSPVAGLPAPGAPGAAQGVVAAGLDEGAPRHFALRSVDRAGNASALSNGVEVVTATAPPGTVTDLRVIAGTDTSVTLRWTATGDDGGTGRPRAYAIRAAETPLDGESFDAAPIAVEAGASADAGGRETAVLGGVARGRRYWIALRAEDRAGNRSPLSNVVSAWIGPLAARPGLALEPGARPARPPVRIYWQRGAGDPARPLEIRVVDVAGRLARAIRLGPEREGITDWDGTDAGGRALPAGLYFAALADGRDRARTRIVLLR